MALDETQIERLMISLEANTSKLDTQIVKSSALLDKQLSTMESRTQSWATRMEKSFGGAGTASGRAFAATLDQGTAGLRNYASQLGPLGAILSSVGGGWLLAGGALGGFGYLLEQGTVRLAEHERLLATVGGVLRATGAASGQTATSIEDMADRISASTLQTRDSVLQAATELLSFRNIAPESFEPALRAAADLSQVFGIDLPTAAKQLGKALDEPLQGMTALRRFGVTFTAEQDALIKKFADTGDIAKADGVIFDALKDKIGGASGAAHSGLSGATHDFSEVWDKLLRDLAGSSGSAGAASTAIAGITFAVNALDTAIKNSGGVMEFMARLATLSPLPGGAPAPPKSRAFNDLAAYNAEFGPAIARDNDQRALVGAVNDVVTAMKQKAEELKKSPLVQAIDTALKDAAEKAKVPVGEFAPGGKYAAQGAQIRAVAIEEYNLGQARKETAKATIAAKEAEKKALADLSAEARGTLAVYKHIDEMTAKAHGAKPGDERARAVQEEIGKLSPEQSYLSAQVGNARGIEFDAETLAAQLAKGRDLVRNYQDQTTALTADKAAAEADKFTHDALVEIYQKTGSVSDEAAAAIRAQAQAIVQSGHAAEAASAAYRDQVTVTDTLRDGLDKMAETGVHGFKGLRQATQGLLQDMAAMIIKLYVMGPLLKALLGPPGTAGGGAGGSALDLLFGGSGANGGIGSTPNFLSSLGVTSGSGVGELADVPAYSGASSGGIASIFASIGSLFGFSSGGRVGGHGNRDTVLARLTPGEVVMNRDAVSRHGALLDAMNEGRIPGYASGGPVGRVSVPSVPRIGTPVAGGHVYAPRMQFSIDARGGEIGVEDKIDARLRDAAPAIIGQSLAQFHQLFPKTLSDVLRDRG